MALLVQRRPHPPHPSGGEPATLSGTLFRPGSDKPRPKTRGALPGLLLFALLFAGLSCQNGCQNGTDERSIGGGHDSAPASTSATMLALGVQDNRPRVCDAGADGGMPIVSRPENRAMK